MSSGGGQRETPRVDLGPGPGCLCREELSLGTEVCLCLESSLNKNMLNSFLFYQLAASNR